MLPHMDEFDQLCALYRRRHSCRAFKSIPVPRNTIERILDNAQQTASWSNTQPWKVIVTSGSATNDFREVMLRQCATAPVESDIPWPSGYSNEYQQRRRECGLSLYQSIGVRRDDIEGVQRQVRENFRFFGAPHVALVTTAKDLGTYGAVDCGGYITSFMLIAQSLGIATIAQGALSSRSAAIHEHFGLDENRQIICGIAFGYADTAHPINGFRTARAKLSEVVSWVD